MRNLGLILLAIWLILTGLIPLLGLNFPQAGLLLAILAIAAGVLLLLEARGGWAGAGRNRRDWYSGNLGFLLLGVYLILIGILPFLKITAPGLDIVLAILAVAAGVLLLVRRA